MLSNEQQLLARISQGDHGALGQLLEGYQHRLFNMCMRILGNRDDAAEVTQDAMVKIVEHIGDYNGKCAISTWMTRIVINLSISHLRKRRLRLTASLDTPQFAVSDNADDQSSELKRQIQDSREPAPDSCVQKREMLEHVQTAMRHLDEDFRAVLVLRDVEELDYDQMSEILGIPPGTIRSRLFRARLALRHELTKLSPSLMRKAAGMDLEA